MKIILPYPDKRLSPNARVHHYTLYKAKKAARKSAWAIAQTIPRAERKQLAADDGPIPMSVTFYPPDNRERDLDNAIASMKASMDGIADALKVNDARFAPSYSFGTPEKPGRVEIVVGNLTEGAAA